MQLRATCISSAVRGMPLIPSIALTAPSFMLAFSVSVLSSQWRATGKSSWRHISIQRTMTCEFCIGKASSLAATIPARFSAARSAGCSPSIPRVSAPMGATKIPPASGDALLSKMKSISAGLSSGGSVFGMQQMVVYPPAAADCVPVMIVSL